MTTHYTQENKLPGWQYSRRLEQSSPLPGGSVAKDDAAMQAHSATFPAEIDPVEALARMRSEKVLGSTKRRLGERLADWRLRVGLSVREDWRGLSDMDKLAVALCALVVVTCLAGIWRAFN